MCASLGVCRRGAAEVRSARVVDVAEEGWNALEMLEYFFCNLPPL